MRLDTAITDYLDSLRAETRSPRTIDAYARDLRMLQQWLGAERNVGTVTPPELLAFVRTELVLRMADGTARNAATTNRVRSAVRGLFGFLVRAWVIPADPSLALRVKAVRAPRPELLSRIDEERLLAAMATDGSALARRDLLIVRLLLATGIRVSSLVALDVEDVDLDHARLHVPLKGERRMEVALDPDLGRELLGLRRSGPLFASLQNRRLTTRAVQLRFAEWLQIAGVERAITVHALRHTFGTRAYEQTKDIRRVQRALGHASVVTTERYVAE